MILRFGVIHSYDKNTGEGCLSDSVYRTSVHFTEKNLRSGICVGYICDDVNPVTGYKFGKIIAPKLIIGNQEELDGNSGMDR